jgi:4-amino-4-deoxy-L-arabinose transferase-like glycosyltransferase
MLANVATLVLTGEIVRAMRGGVFATAVACAAQALAPVFLAFGHFYSMNSLDSVFWALGAWLFLRILDAPTTPRWLALGVVLGLGLENKASILWLGAGIAVALLAYRRDLLKTRGPWLTALVTALLFAPNVAWETIHGWPTVEFAKNAMRGKYKEHSVLGFFSGVPT